MPRSDQRVTPHPSQRVPGRLERGALAATRVWLPTVIAVAGAAMIGVVGVGPDRPLAVAGMVLIGTALMVWMLNWMFRMSVESNREREREEQAREEFARTGRWPGEE
jgi:threonine/homoserine/homoserine lactone efflux protein